ncbi:MAG: ATPase, partial [Mesorhizobium sp.]
MTQNLDPSSTARSAPDDRRDRFATLTFERDVAAPSSVLWQAWTAPAARAIWA